jgi:WYL domain
MALSSLLSDFRALLHARPDFVPPVPKGRQVRIGPSDSAEVHAAPAPSAPSPELGWAGGQSFAIVYRDANGEESERRVTVRNLSLNAPDVPVLVAWCHERQDMRSFRLDRIVAVITNTGDVVDPPGPFFARTFGMSPRLARVETAASVSLDRIRRNFSHHMMLLGQLGLADGDFAPREREVVLDHCLHLTAEAGAAATPDEEEALSRYLETFRPTKLFVDRAVARAETDPHRRLVALFDAAEDLIDADGVRHAAEIEFLGRLKRELKDVRSA